MSDWYYIIDKVFSSNLQDCGLSVRIIKIPEGQLMPIINDGDGPCQSIRALKKHSKIFKEFCKKGSKQLEKLLKEKNFFVVKDLMYVPTEHEYSKDFMKLLDHASCGNIKDKNVFGFHFYDKNRIRIVEITKKEDEFGVWAAKIEVFSDIKNEWIKKNKESSFFPTNWSLNQLFHECDFAFENKVKRQNSDYIYASTTKSGVNVEIIVKNGEVKSMYPIQT